MKNDLEEIPQSIPEKRSPKITRHRLLFLYINHLRARRSLFTNLKSNSQEGASRPRRFDDDNDDRQDHSLELRSLEYCLKVDKAAGHSTGARKKEVLVWGFIQRCDISLKHLVIENTTRPTATSRARACAACRSIQRMTCFCVLSGCASGEAAILGVLNSSSSTPPSIPEKRSYS